MRTNINNVYYRKDKKCQIYKSYEEDGQDEWGFDSGDAYIKPIAPKPIWCYTKQISQEQIYNAHAFMSDETRFFVINYREDVAQGDLVHYIAKNKWYEVTQATSPADYKTELYIYVKDIDHAPDPSDIRPYS